MADKRAKVRITSNGRPVGHRTGVNVHMTEEQVRFMPDQMLAKIVRDAMGQAKERAKEHGEAISVPLVLITAELATERVES